MASTYSDLKFELIGTGEQAGTWGATTNTNLGTAIEQAIAGKADITFSSTTETLTLTNTNAAQDARAIYLNLGGTPGGAASLVVPAIEKPYIVKNGTGQTVTVKVSGQTGVAVPNGKTMWLYNNGTDVVNAIDNLPAGTTINGSSVGTGSVTSVAVSGGTTGLTTSGGPITSSGTITLAGTLAVANGGTGQTTASAAINALVPSQTGNSGKYLTTNGTAVSWGTVSGTGDVVGPASVTSNSIVAFDGTTGKLIQSTDAARTFNIFPNATQLTIGAAGTANLGIGVGSVLGSASLTGSYNIAIGQIAGNAVTTGQYNTLVGDGAGFAVNTGSNNTFYGASAGQVTSSGSDNTAVGYLAGEVLTSGSQNTAVGSNSLDSIAPSNSSALGYDAQVTGSNQVQLGNASTTTYVYGTVQNRSDQRDKADIRDTQLGLNFIAALRPVDYKWDMREDYKAPKPVKENYESTEAYIAAITQWHEDNDLSNITHDGTHKRTRYHHGLIAQEVKQVMDAQGIDFGGYQDHTINGGRDVLSIGYDELVAPMIKAIQELTARLEAAEAEIAALKG